MQPDYHYRERQTELDPQREFRLGKGKISGYCSLFLCGRSMRCTIRSRNSIGWPARVGISSRCFPSERW